MVACIVIMVLDVQMPCKISHMCLGMRSQIGSLAILLLAMSGCNSGDSLQLAPVRGSVTYQGKLLDHGDVVFNPFEGTKGLQSVGVIAEDGSFEMRTASREGAPLGKYIVTVQCRQKPTAKQADDLSFIPPLLIPQKYSEAEQSPLRFEVKSENNSLPIELN